MTVLEKLKRAFTTNKNLSKSSEKQTPWPSLNEFDRHMQMLRQKQREAEYNAALNAVNPMAIINTNHTGQASMGAINQAWSPSAAYPAQTESNKLHFTVEKVDNGFILRSASYEGGKSKTKIAADADELKDLFIASIVEHRIGE